MTIIDGVVFTAFFLPLVLIGREEGVGIGGGVVNLRETETVGDFQSLTIDGGTTDDVDVFVGGAMGQGLIEGVIDITAFKSLCAAAQDDVTTVGEGSLGEGEVGVAAHDDGMACGERLEALQVVREPIDQLVLESNGAVLRYGSYN